MPSYYAPLVIELPVDRNSLPYFVVPDPPFTRDTGNHRVHRTLGRAWDGLAQQLDLISIFQHPEQTHHMDWKSIGIFRARRCSDV
jgi:hypothetical protein